MALHLVMDSAFPNLFSRAKSGHPQAIATLVEQRLGDDEIDVTAWNRQGLLHLDLMSFERQRKAELLPAVRHVLAQVSPDSIRGIKVSSYIYGEESPCWMERWGSVAEIADEQTDAANSSRRLFQRWRIQGQGLILEDHRRRYATGAIALLALVGAALGIVFYRHSSRPSFAQQEESGEKVIRSRSGSAALEEGLKP